MSRLWLSDDHLLLTHTGYTERYRRFFFDDIEALVLRTSRRGAVLSAVLVSTAILPGLALLLLWPGRTFWIVTFSLLLASLLLHWWRGPTVACHLRTAVSTVRLHSLGRLRLARPIVDRLQALIEQAQGRLDDAQLEQLRSRVVGEPDPEPQRVAPPPLPPLATAAHARPYRGRVHLLLFVALLLEGGVSALQTAVESSLLDAGATLLFLVEIGLAMAAVVLQRRGRVDQALVRLTWTSLATLLLLVMVVSYVSLVAGLSEAGVPALPAMAESRWSSLLHVALLTPQGLLGLVLWARWRARSPRSPAPPPLP